MAFKDNFKKFIETQVEAAVDLIFANAHGYAMTESGDIYPEQVFKLDELKQQLQDLVYQQTVDNLTEKQKEEYGLTGKMTAEEIEQHIQDHPTEGFDQCSKCQGIEVHGTMKSLNDSINCTALICDDCAASEDTVYNRCTNCDFDMGESYENCGAAEDGTCPECGHDNQEPAAVLWNVPVTRVGYGYNLVAVTARSEEEAIELALEEAGSEEFSEKSSEYMAPDGAHKIG